MECLGLTVDGFSFGLHSGSLSVHSLPAGFRPGGRLVRRDVVPGQQGPRDAAELPERGRVQLVYHPDDRLHLQLRLKKC